VREENKHISEEHLMAYLVKEADAQLIKEIEHWLSLSEENQERLNELEATWAESGKLKIPPVVVDVDAAWNKLSGLMDVGELSSQQTESIENSVDQTDADQRPTRKLDTAPRRTSRITMNLIRVAAVVVLAIGLWSIRNALLKPQLQMFASTDQVEAVGLSDGSVVSMNENTSMIVPEKFTGKTREVELAGEAFFDIEPDKNKPFIIKAEDAYIKVLGTSFNVKALDESPEVEVYVEEGVVMLYSIEEITGDTASVLLNVGETGLYDKKTREVRKVGETDIEVLYWLNKTLIFEETDLWRVFEILEITYEVDITLQDSTVNNCKLNATFKDERIDYILEVIAITFGLEVEKDETLAKKTYFIKGEGCEY
jgi:transmembrane sensor